MTRLKTRHERFCRSFVECTNATLAAKVAGYSPRSARNAGYRLLRQSGIIARISEIQKETAQAHCRDVDVLLGKLEMIYRRAVDDHHFAAATRAVELQAKLSGVGPLSPSRLRPAPAALADKRQPAQLDREPAAQSGSACHAPLPVDD